MVDPSQEANSGSLLDQVANKRGLSDSELRSGIEDLPDESLFANIERVAERILDAMFNNEPLVIFGHDDPDGITSTYILYHFLNSCGYQKHNYFIPNRNIEPHGIQSGFIDFVEKGGYKLVITVDNGISSYEGVERLNELGCDTIITDHHLIQPERLPRAYALLNPRLPECKYPYKTLAGVGVALMLIRYLAKKLGHEVPLAYYFWTAVGSIADKVPMTGVNRILVRHVLHNWEENQDPSVEFLQRNYNRIGNDTDRFNFIHNTSRLIANGREENGQHTAMRFLLQMGDAKAALFESMEAQKKEWESELHRVFSFLDVITARFEGRSFIYYDDQDIIPYTLLGTSASYILNRLHIPVIMLKTHNDRIVCEGRCEDGFNMVDAFSACKEYLEQFGGHPKAAGFSLEQNNYEGFLECYNRHLNETLSGKDPQLEAEPEASLSISGFSRDEWEELELLLPFGQQNPEPLILFRNATLQDLQDLFQIEHSSHSIPRGKRGRALVHWKAPDSVRIVSFEEQQTVN